MARTLIPVAATSRFALTVPVAKTCDATNGNYIINDGSTCLHFSSTSGSAQTVTVILPAGADVNLTVGPRVIAIPANLAGGDTGFWPINAYGNQLLFTSSSALVSVYAESFA